MEGEGIRSQEYVMQDGEFITEVAAHFQKVKKNIILVNSWYGTNLGAYFNLWVVAINISASPHRKCHLPIDLRLHFIII